MALSAISVPQLRHCIGVFYRTMRTLLLLLSLAAGAPQSPSRPAADDPETRITAVEQEMLTWRRYLHEHPELSNRETETGKYIAAQLRSVGLEPRTGVARTRVVAVLRGGQPGPVVALRSDM